MAMFRQYLLNLALFGRIDPVEYYVCDRYRVVYVENAKVACTAIKQILFPDVDYVEHGQEGFHAALRSRALHRIPPEAQDYLRFSIFRNPAARLASAFGDKILKEAADTNPGIFDTRFHRMVFAVFAGADVSRQGFSLADFASAVGRIPDRLRDRHIASQTPAYRAVTAAPDHFVGKLETLDRDWAELRDRAGLPELPLTNRGPATGELAIGPEAMARVRAIYQEDYTLLGYLDQDLRGC